MSMNKDFLFMAAPLEDNSDGAFRTLCHKHGADVTFTEMIRLKALVRGNKSTWSRLAVHDDTPTVIQLLVSNEKELSEFLSKFEPFRGFLGFNMNLGCPAPEVIRAGLGSAMMKRTAKVQRLIDIFRKYNFPISIKTRLGLNAYEKKSKAYLNLIKNTSPDCHIIHLRHAAQTYETPADWSVLSEIMACAKEHGKKIVINGDINNKEQIALLKKEGAYGAMIGRAAVYNPSIFNFLKGHELVGAEKIRAEYSELAKKYNSTPRFTENVLKRMGRDTKSLDKKLLI